MSYATIFESANDATFQGRCRAALWDISQKVLAGDSGYPAAGMVSVQPLDDTAYALRVLRDQTTVSDRVLAMQVLRNSTIAANPAASADNDLAWQINNAIWAELRSIG